MHRTFSLHRSPWRFGAVVASLALLAGAQSGCTTVRPVAQERIGMITQNISANAESSLRGAETMVATTGPDTTNGEIAVATLH